MAKKKRPCKYGPRRRGKCPRKQQARRTGRAPRTMKQKMAEAKRRFMRLRRQGRGKHGAPSGKPKVSFYDLPYAQQVARLKKKYPLNDKGEPDRLYADEYERFKNCGGKGKWVSYLRNCDGTLIPGVR